VLNGRQGEGIRPSSIRALRQETWFLARCFEALAGAGIRGVVSFADPVLRRAADGRIVCPMAEVHDDLAEHAIPLANDRIDWPTRSDWE
jgi:hypothetical protein